MTLKMFKEAQHQAQVCLTHLHPTELSIWSARFSAHKSDVSEKHELD